jgi:hypothetical protein
MTISNWLLVAMGMLFFIPTIIYKEYFLAFAFLLYGLCFGFLEFVSAYYTKHTISQHLWELLVAHQWKGAVILVCMLLAWICLILHLAGVGRK